VKAAVVVVLVIVVAGGAAYWLISSSATHAPTPPSPTPSAPAPAVPQKKETAEDLVAELASAETRGHAQLALQDMGAAALPALAKAVPTSEGATRETIVALIAASGDKTYVPTITPLLDSKDESAQVGAIRAIAQMNASEEKDRLLKIARDAAAPARARVAAGEALAGWKAPEVVPVLLSWLPPTNESYHDRQSLDRTVRTQRSKAVLLLGSMGAPEAVEPLRTILLGSDGALQEESAAALLQLGDPGLDAVRAALATNDPPRLINVIRALGRSKHPKAQELVRPFATDEREGVRRVANESMAVIERRKKG
jgi:HEAT repeat protein